ncbi:MAG: hypothetical protein V4549_15320 [Bacteroidota bacterium]
MFTVKEVVNGDEIKVEPEWSCEDNDGNLIVGNHVIVFGYRTPQFGMAGYEFAKKKLEALTQGKEIELYNPQFLKRFGEKIVCSVYLDDVDIANYFPEFKSNSSLKNYTG